MELRHKATGRKVGAHEKAVPIYLANGWEAVNDDPKSDTSGSRAATEPPAKRRRKAAD